MRRWDGTSWVEMGPGSASGGGISNNSGASWYPSLAISPDGTPIVAWMNDSNGNYEIYVRRWDGTAWVEMGTGSASGGGISNNSGDSESPSLAISPNGTPIIAWDDKSSGKEEIYVRRWDSTAWVEMGTDSASGGGISNNSRASYDSSLAIDPDGLTIIAWHDWSNSPPYPNENSEIYVRYWNGTEWVEMGSGSATGGGISDDKGSGYSPSLAIGPDGIPVIAWGDWADDNPEIYVRRWQPFEAAVADFEGTPTEGVFPLDVQFTSLSTGDFNECLWDFGDGRTAAVCGSPTRKFREPGNYTISLTVKGAGGEDTMTRTHYIIVQGPPTADFNVTPTSGLPPLTVQFTNLSTGDFNECLWDFGDGRTRTTCGNPTLKFRKEGHFTVSLTVKGPGGEDTKTIKQCITVGHQRIFLPGVMGTTAARADHKTND